MKEREKLMEKENKLIFFYLFFSLLTLSLFGFVLANTSNSSESIISFTNFSELQKVMARYNISIDDSFKKNSGFVDGFNCTQKGDFFNVTLPDGTNIIFNASAQKEICKRYDLAENCANLTKEGLCYQELGVCSKNGTVSFNQEEGLVFEGINGKPAVVDFRNLNRSKLENKRITVKGEGATVITQGGDKYVDNTFTVSKRNDGSTTLYTEESVVDIYREEQGVFKKIASLQQGKMTMQNLNGRPGLRTFQSFNDKKPIVTLFDSDNDGKVIAKITEQEFEWADHLTEDNVVGTGNFPFLRTKKEGEVMKLYAENSKGDFKIEEIPYDVEVFTKPNGQGSISYFKRIIKGSVGYTEFKHDKDGLKIKDESRFSDIDFFINLIPLDKEDFKSFSFVFDQEKYDQKENFLSKKVYYVIVKEAPLREKPFFFARIIELLKLGDGVEIVDKSWPWFFVYPVKNRETKGYIHSSHIFRRYLAWRGGEENLNPSAKVGEVAFGGTKG